MVMKIFSQRHRMINHRQCFLASHPSMYSSLVRALKIGVWRGNFLFKKKKIMNYTSITIKFLIV